MTSPSSGRAEGTAGGVVVILLGPPGVGKGTQGSFLVEERGWHRIATGDLLREARRAGTELGERARRYMDAGELVPDELILELCRKEMAGREPGQGVLLDGFPRTVAQAEGLAELLPDLGRRVDAVVLLEADDKVLVKRLSGRRSCPECGSVYNVHFDPPEQQGACDRCGAELVHRSDDDPDTVRRRLQVYREQTEPLVAFYEEREPPVLGVPGEGSVEEVREAVRRVLDRELEQVTGGGTEG